MVRNANSAFLSADVLVPTLTYKSLSPKIRSSNYVRIAFLFFDGFMLLPCCWLKIGGYYVANMFFFVLAFYAVIYGVETETTRQLVYLDVSITLHNSV